MKSLTMHILLGVGIGATTISAAVSTALACRAIRREEENLGRELTAGEKFKVGFPYYIPVVGALGATEVGVMTCYKTSQEAIKLTAGGTVAMTNVLNGYRDVIKEEVGKKKEADLYNKSLEQSVLPRIPEKQMTDSNEVLVSIMPYECSINDIPDFAFVSTPDKIQAGLAEFNTMFGNRVRGNGGTDGYASFDELLAYWGQDPKNHIFRKLFWEWRKDGPVELVEPKDFIVRNGQKIWLLSFVVQPHYI